MQPSGRPTYQVDNTGFHGTGISQLLFLSVELSPFPWLFGRRIEKE
jgi:hypothetical protein